MFSKGTNSESKSVAQTPPSPDFVWYERFRDVSRVTVTPAAYREGKGTFLLLNVELSESGNNSTHFAENEVRTTLTIEVEEREAPAFMKLLGKRLLLRDLRFRTTFEKMELEQRVNELTMELDAALSREEALRSNLHTLVEGTRRLR